MVGNSEVESSAEGCQFRLACIQQEGQNHEYNLPLCRRLVLDGTLQREMGAFPSLLR
jgi:hypothetical protein